MELKAHVPMQELLSLQIAAHSMVILFLKAFAVRFANSVPWSLECIAGPCNKLIYPVIGSHTVDRFTVNNSNPPLI